MLSVFLSFHKCTQNFFWNTFGNPNLYAKKYRIKESKSVSLKSLELPHNLKLVKENGKCFLSISWEEILCYKTFIVSSDNIQHDIRLNPWDYRCRRLRRTKWHQKSLHKRLPSTYFQKWVLLYILHSVYFLTIHRNTT